MQAKLNIERPQKLIRPGNNVTDSDRRHAVNREGRLIVLSAPHISVGLMGIEKWTNDIVSVIARHIQNSGGEIRHFEHFPAERTVMINE